MDNWRNRFDAGSMAIAVPLPLLLTVLSIETESVAGDRWDPWLILFLWNGTFVLWSLDSRRGRSTVKRRAAWSVVGLVALMAVWIMLLILLVSTGQQAEKLFRMGLAGVSVLLVGVALLILIRRRVRSNRDCRRAGNVASDRP